MVERPKFSTAESGRCSIGARAATRQAAVDPFPSALTTGLLVLDSAEDPIYFTILEHKHSHEHTDPVKMSFLGRGSSAPGQVNPERVEMATQEYVLCMYPGSHI